MAHVLNAELLDREAFQMLVSGRRIDARHRKHWDLGREISVVVFLCVLPASRGLISPRSTAISARTKIRSAAHLPP